ncbi:uncharacterized protein LOC125494016 [Beta vulgaris subsp. vulgaris]|uniref:uncharacterized protein LOC125494016 n=1 Tax=Beta vulgaris subsp. vulgaris TaxID=3555 RepID=UPI002036E915|nr:uncharacterized protein LOC125494016 [Beta vulgaris subsp. vulgaris]
MLERLRTTDRLKLAGICVDDNCVFCSGKESHKHLFFECDYAQKCLQVMRSWLSLNQNHIWFSRMLKFLSRSRRTQFQRRVIAVVYSALAYYIWWARNEVFWNHTVWRPEVLCKKIRSIVLLRVSLVLPKKISVKDQEWFEVLKSENV